MLRSFLKKAKHILKISLSSIVFISIIPLIYTLLKEGDLLKRLFDFNYLIATIIILYGLLSFLVPVNLKKSNRLVDHSNYADVSREEKEKKTDGAMESLFWGISNILIVSLFELLIRTLI